MLSGMSNVLGAVVSVDLRLQLPQKDVCSGVHGKRYSFKASARIQAHTPRWGLRRRHCASAEFWVKELVNPERKPWPLFWAWSPTKLLWFAFEMWPGWRCWGLQVYMVWKWAWNRGSQWRREPRMGGVSGEILNNMRHDAAEEKIPACCL